MDFFYVESTRLERDSNRVLGLNIKEIFVKKPERDKSK